MDAVSPIEPNNMCEICVCLKSLKTTKKVKIFTHPKKTKIRLSN